MWCSTHLRISGPSLSRKNRLSAVNARKAASEASADTPAPTPLRSASNASLTDELASSPALCALLVLTPASCSQPSIVSTALWRLFSSSGAWLVTPDSSSDDEQPAQRDDAEEDDRGGAAAPQPVPREPADHRRENRGDDRRRDDRNDDRRRDREQRDHTGEQEQRADHQPRHQPQVAQPRRDGEHMRQPGRRRSPRTSRRRPARPRDPLREPRVAVASLTSRCPCGHQRSIAAPPHPRDGARRSLILVRTPPAGARDAPSQSSTGAPP